MFMSVVLLLRLTSAYDLLLPVLGLYRVNIDIATFKYLSYLSLLLVFISTRRRVYYKKNVVFYSQVLETNF